MYSSANQVGSDKGTTHDYIRSYYDREFTPRRDEKLVILEIGVQYGGSIYLWSNFFRNALVYGIDIGQYQLDEKYFSIKDNHRVKLIYNDAYSPSVVETFPESYFDYIIDDGPHTLHSQRILIQQWLPKLKSGGKLIIEDITGWTDAYQGDDADHVDLGILELAKYAWAHNMTKTVSIVDSRKQSGRFDDVIIEITRK